MDETVVARMAKQERQEAIDKKMFAGTYASYVTETTTQIVVISGYILKAWEPD